MTIHKNISRSEMAARLRQLRRDGARFQYSINTSGRRNLSTTVGKGSRFYYNRP